MEALAPTSSHAKFLRLPHLIWHKRKHICVGGKNASAYLETLNLNCLMVSFLAGGNTPAHCAASGHMSAMNCLINHGSDVTIANHQGDTPDMVARKHGHTQANQKAGMTVGNP